MRAINHHQERTRPILRNTLPSRSTPSRTTRPHPRRTPQPQPVDPPHRNQSATHHPRHRSIKHQPKHLGHLPTSPRIPSRRRPRLRPQRRQHQLHRPRPRDQRQHHRPASTRPHQQRRHLLRRTLTQRHRHPRMDPHTTNKPQPLHPTQRPHRRVVQHRALHHHHRQPAVTLIPARAPLSA